MKSGNIALQEVIAAVAVVWEHMEVLAKPLSTWRNSFKMTALIITDVVTSGNHAHQLVIAAVIIVWELMEKPVKLVIVPFNLCLFSDYFKMSSWKTWKTKTPASRYSTSVPVMGRTKMTAANTSPAKDKHQVRQTLFACHMDLSQLKESLSICLLSSESNHESLKY